MKPETYPLDHWVNFKGQEERDYLTEIMQDCWDTYVKEQGFTKKQEAKHLSSFFAGGHAVLAAMQAMQVTRMKQ